jgi:hypothetical protein
MLPPSKTEKEKEFNIIFSIAMQYFCIFNLDIQSITMEISFICCVLPLPDCYRTQEKWNILTEENLLVREYSSTVWKNYSGFIEATTMTLRLGLFKKLTTSTVLAFRIFETYWTVLSLWCACFPQMNEIVSTLENLWFPLFYI